MLDALTLSGPVSSASVTSVLPPLVLQGGVFGSPLGRLLLTVLVLMAVVLVGRVILAIAWKLLLIAAVVIGALLVLGFVFPTL